MRLGKNKTTSVIGMFLLVSFMVLSFFHDFLFMKELVICSVIIALVLFLRFKEKEPSPKKKSSELKLNNSAVRKRKPDSAIATSTNRIFSPAIQKG